MANDKINPMTVRFNSRIYKLLEQLAKQMGVSKADVIRILIAEKAKEEGMK